MSGCRAANATFVAMNRPEAGRFAAALQRCEAVQREYLRDCLSRNAETDFGRLHRFSSLGNVEAFREAVPMRTYDELRPWIERAADGEGRVLTAEAVRLFEPSSGTTAASKLIPYTATLQAEFQRAIAPWIVDMYGSRPALLGGPAYWSISPMACAGRTSGGIAIGFEEDSAYLAGEQKALVDAVMAVPGEVRFIGDVDAFRYATLLFLLAARELRFVSAWNPTFLTLLLGFMEARWDELLHDLARGTSRFHLPDSVKIRLKPHASRARRLASIDPVRPVEVWPRLRLVSCWTDAHAAPLVSDLRARFPGVEIQGKGLIATEAFVSLPYGGGDERVLALTSHFFEFVDGSGRACMAHEVEPGADYEVVVTTGGGLYRYRLGDRVHVTGFRGATPCLVFLGKSGRVSDLRGEKLDETFASGAVTEALAGAGVAARFVRLAPRVVEGQAGYVLEVSCDRLPDDLASRLDAALRASFHYDLCRRLGQLSPIEVVPVPDGPSLDRPGVRMGDVKPSLFG